MVVDSEESDFISISKHATILSLLARIGLFDLADRSSCCITDPAA